jgi:RNA polymerase sigma factor (sigma-70 family)
MITEQQVETYADIDIIDKILAGDVPLYEVLIRRYNPFLYKTGRVYGYNHQDTEDLMQETYISAYRSLAKFENRSSFKTWLIKIMLNYCHHKKRNSSFKKEMVVNELPTEKNKPMFHHDNNTERTLVTRELGHVLENALEKVPEEYRIVFMLREMNGLSTAETAEAANISQSNVKVRLSRAKALLRNEIEKMYSPADIYEFNLVYCDSMVERVMNEIKKETSNNES